MAPRFQRRLLVTLAAIVVVLAAGALRAPGLPALLTTPTVSGEWLGLGRARLLALGLRPYISAAAAWLLLSGLVPALRRLREGDAGQRRRFDAGIVWLALAFAVLQAAAYALYFTNLMAVRGGAGQVAVPLLMVSEVAGAFMLLATAASVTGLGLGNGIAVVLLAESVLPELIHGVRAEWLWLRSEQDLFRMPIALLLLALVVAGWVRFLTASQAVPLERIEGADPARAGGAAEAPEPALRLRLNLLGVVPIALASAANGLPTLIQMTWFPGQTPWLGRPWVYWPVHLVLIVAASYVVVAFGYDTDRVGARLARFGRRLRGVAPAEQGRELDRRIERRLPWAIAVLIAADVLPLLLRRWPLLTASYAGLFGMQTLLGTAIVVELVRHARAVRDLDARVPAAVEGAEGDVAEATEWVEAFEADTELECELAAHVLEEEGVVTARLSNRAIPLTGTLALWEWTAPRYPSLMLHRRLGGGRTVVAVPRAQAERAAEVLAGLAPGLPADE